VEAYNAYFNDEYEKLKKDLSENVDLINDFSFKECFPNNNNDLSFQALKDSGIDY
jgi:hypothetical protein